MTDLYVDTLFNDLRVQKGSIIFVRGIDTTAQQIRVALQVEFGEWYLNTEKGVPYYSETGILNDGTTGILGGKYSAAEIQALISRTILEVANVLKINELNIGTVNDARQLKINGSVTIGVSAVSGIGTQDVVNINLVV